MGKSPRASEQDGPLSEKRPREAGIALFMVIAAMTVLSILVTEFVYIAQVNQRMAFDGLDQIRALYLAKSGFKLSLLRLKAFQKVEEYAKSNGVPPSVIEKIWSFPFLYPVPTDIPGLTPGQKEMITKFTNESSLVGKYSALIESDSSRFNINRILPAFAPEPMPSPTKTPGEADPAYQTRVDAWTATKTFKPEEARKSLETHLEALIAREIENDEDFADAYRDLKPADLADAIQAWVDRGFQHPNPPRNAIVPAKAIPFYSINELHMVQGFDDRLFKLIAPTMTTSLTPGINVNKMDKMTFRALLAMGGAVGVKEEEIDKFFEDRDAEDPDGTFKNEKAFYDYIAKFGAISGKIDDFKQNLETKNRVRVLVDDKVFKITVRSEVNQAVRELTAFVTLLPTAAPPAPPPAGGQPPPPSAPAPAPDSGLKVTFMRIL